MPHSSKGSDPSSSKDKKQMAYVKYRRLGDYPRHRYPLLTQHHDEIEVVTTKDTGKHGDRQKHKRNSTEKDTPSVSRTHHRRNPAQEREEERNDMGSLRDSVPRNGIRRDGNINRPYQPTDDISNRDGSWRGVTSAPSPPGSRYYGINNANAVGDAARRVPQDAAPDTAWRTLSAYSEESYPLTVPDSHGPLNVEKKSTETPQVANTSEGNVKREGQCQNGSGDLSINPMPSKAAGQWDTKGPSRAPRKVRSDPGPLRGGRSASGSGSGRGQADNMPAEMSDNVESWPGDIPSLNASNVRMDRDRRSNRFQWDEGDSCLAELPA